MTHLFSPSLMALAQAFAADCLAHRHRVAVAESCSGGLLAALLTHHSGASAFFTYGFVTYSNQAKSDMLAVPAAMIHRYGAVSSQVACAMACGALQRSQATRSLSITGIAGPSGGNQTKPVGTVYIACQETQDAQPRWQQLALSGDRTSIRLAAIDAVLRFAMTHTATSQS